MIIISGDIKDIRYSKKFKKGIACMLVVFAGMWSAGCVNASEIDLCNPGKDDDGQETCLWDATGLYTKAPLTSCHIFEQAVWHDA